MFSIIAKIGVIRNELPPQYVDIEKAEPEGVALPLRK
jgi:hypothetical protein